MRLFLLCLIVPFVLLGCEPKEDAPQASSEFMPPPELPNVLSQLPGTWLSQTDGLSSVIFESDGRAFDVYDGEVLESGTWQLVIEETSPTRVQLHRKAGNDTLVYSILRLTSDELALSYLPRGNTLSYRRGPIGG